MLPYSQTITAIGGTNPTLTVSNIQNPIPGITVPASGTGSITISGTPTAPGTETFTVTAIDSAGGPSASINYSVTANAVNPSGIVLTSVTGNEDQGAASFIDPSGNIVVAGCSTSAPTSPPSTPFKMGVVRYLPNGSLDTSFNGTGFTTTAAPNSGAYFAFCAADYPASPSDKIVVGGMYSNSVWEFALVPYNANGSLDTTFGTNGQVQTKIGNGGQSQVHGVVALPNGDILAAGSTIDNNLQDFALACYTPAGVLDTTFKPGAGDPVAFTAPKGIVTTAFGGNSRVYSVVLQRVGTQSYILASGVATINGTLEDVLVRYNLNGSLDTTFGTNGVVMVQPVSSQPSMIVDPAGDIFVGGEGSSSTMAIAEYSPSGTLDTAFTNNIAADNVAGGVGSMALQPNGQIVTSGAVPPAAPAMTPIIRLP